MCPHRCIYWESHVNAKRMTSFWESDDPSLIGVNIGIPCIALIVYVDEANSRKRNECAKSSKGVF